MEFDTLARHGVAVVAMIGNNGIWALEKHPMEALYGYSVVAELRPETRYDEVAAALGVPRRARARARASFARRSSVRSRPGRRPLVNVLTDPAVAYPRRSNLA